MRTICGMLLSALATLACLLLTAALTMAKTGNASAPVIVRLSEQDSVLYVPLMTAGCGDRIAFSSNRAANDDTPHNYEIYLMNGDGSGQARLTHHPGRDSVPAWSPDAKQIAVSGDGVWVLEADARE